MTGQLQVGGTAGQVILFELASETGEDADIPVIKADLVTEGFIWKGHQALLVKAEKFKMPMGFQPKSILQISPPASINSLAFSNNYGLLAVGTTHGLVVLDTIQSNIVLAKCTLNAQGTVKIFSNLVNSSTKLFELQRTMHSIPIRFFFSSIPN